MNQLLIIGSVAFDDIQTPFGKKRGALGGSASYISLAASQFCQPAIVAVVGADFNAGHKKVFIDRNIDVSGLKAQRGKTFRWGGKYGFDLNSRETLFTHLNVFENFKPRLAATHKNISHVFLGNIHPRLQLDVLKQAKKPALAGLDTMNFWIERAPKDLARVLKQVDVLIINDSESRELSKEHNLVKAAKKILGMMGKEPNTLIIKRGEYGLLMFRRNQMFHLPGFPLEDVIDPTGAGDSFAGGFMGYLAKTGNSGWENMKKAAVFGSVTASFCVELMGTRRLENLLSGDVTRRYKAFKNLTHFEI